MKSALITGINGQDGSYLADLLLEKGYKIFGITRRGADLTNINHALKRIALIEAELLDAASLTRALQISQADEFYNLAAPSFVPASWEDPVKTSMITGIGVANILETIRKCKPEIKYYQASSSEMFGRVTETPQNENTPFRPKTPYGAAKVFGYWMTTNYREMYKMFTCSGILFNHESPRRGLMYVTRKVTNAAARIKLGLQKNLFLGNLEAKRDWGYAGDYVKAMWLMLQQDIAMDYVIATGRTHSVRELCETAFSAVNLNYEEYVEVDPKFIRPLEKCQLVGDYSKAKEKLGWEPNLEFKELIEMMVKADIELLSRKNL